MSGFIKSAESLPVLLGVSFTAYLNDASSQQYGRAGYYVCAAMAAISAIVMFFVGYPQGGGSCTPIGGGGGGGSGGGGPVVGRPNLSKYSANGSITSHCTLPTNECPDLLSSRSFNNTSARYSSGVVANGSTWCTKPHAGCATLTSGAMYGGGHPHYSGAAASALQHGVYTTANSGGGTSNGTRCRNHGNCAAANGNGRLQKSLSFAFQNPSMWDDGYGGSCAATAPYASGITASSTMGSASGGYNYATYRPTSRYVWGFNT